MGCSGHPCSIGHVREVLASVLGPRIGVDCSTVDGDPHSLYPEERVSIAYAVPRRQREFAAGRAAAREAMVRLGLTPVPITSGSDRAPNWPTGLVGSISHTREICIAAVGRADEVGAIGIDVEEHLSDDPDLWSSICTTEEQAHLHSQPVAQRSAFVTKLFSAKEAFYKWQYPLTGQLLDFQDVQVALDPDGGGFRVQPANGRQWPDALDQAAGGLFTNKKWVIAWVCGHPSVPNVR